MNGETFENSEKQFRQGSDEIASIMQDSCFGEHDYNVSTGVDVKANGPEAAMAAAIEGMGLRDPESYCFRVEHLRTGRRWEVELYPSGEIEVEDMSR